MSASRDCAYLPPCDRMVTWLHPIGGSPHLKHTHTTRPRNIPCSAVVRYQTPTARWHSIYSIQSLSHAANTMRSLTKAYTMRVHPWLYQYRSLTTQAYRSALPQKSTRLCSGNDIIPPSCQGSGWVFTACLRHGHSHRLACTGNRICCSSSTMVVFSTGTISTVTTYLAR